MDTGSYDGRNIYAIEEMKDAGVEYYSIGRAAVGANEADKLSSPHITRNRLSIA